MSKTELQLLSILNQAGFVSTKIRVIGSLVFICFEDDQKESASDVSKLLSCAGFKNISISRVYTMIESYMLSAEL
jgi:hypothetical protein